MALHLSSDFNLREWVSVVLLLTTKTAPLLERASRGESVQAPEVIYYTQVPVATQGKVIESAN